MEESLSSDLVTVGSFAGSNFYGQEWLGWQSHWEFWPPQKTKQKPYTIGLVYGQSRSFTINFCPTSIADLGHEQKLKWLRFSEFHHRQEAAPPPHHLGVVSLCHFARWQPFKIDAWSSDWVYSLTQTHRLGMPPKKKKTSRQTQEE